MQHCPSVRPRPSATLYAYYLRTLIPRRHARTHARYRRHYYCIYYTCAYDYGLLLPNLTLHVILNKIYIVVEKAVKDRS